MLTVESVSKHYPTRGEDLVVLRDVSLSVNRGESVAIMGPSGSGKSTLLNILGTLEPPTAGRVDFDGVDPFALRERDLAGFRNRKIGFVFQDHHLLPQCSTLENVLIASLPARSARRDAPANLAPARMDAPMRARELLDRVGLSGRLDHRPAELSGGERQRAALARALINGPALLLADEPTGNLDRATADKIAELLLELHRAESTILIVVTHSASLAARFGRTCELVDGRLAACPV